VGGVSLVTTYRDTFASEVRERGIDGLIKSLAAKNRGRGLEVGQVVMRVDGDALVSRRADSASVSGSPEPCAIG